MKLTKVSSRVLLQNDPFSEELKKYSSIRKNMLTFLVMGIFIASGIFACFKIPFLKDLFTPLLDSIKTSIYKFRQMSRWMQFLVLGPALLFDSTRYYLTNLIAFLVLMGKKIFVSKTPHPYTNPLNCPLVSVIVPVYNERKTIRHTLDSLLENNYPNFELIVIDDCSSDRTSVVCSKYQAEGKITYMRKRARGGKPNSLNYGLKLAKGKIIIHVDGDCIFYRDAILNAVKPFINPKVGAVAGNLRVMNDKENLLTELQSIEYGMCINVQRRWLSMTDTLQIASGAFSCFRKELLEDLMGVDTETGEDLDITLKIRKMGYKVVFVPEAICLTEVPDTLSTLARQRILWDRCYIRISLRKHFNIADLRHFRFGDFLSVITDIIFNLIILLFFPVYIVWISIFYPKLLVFVLTVTYLFYGIVNLFQIVLAILMSQDIKRDVTFIFYAPLYFFYATYLRMVRTFAYILEIFRMHYFKVGAFPQQVWKNMPEHW